METSRHHIEPAAGRLGVLIVGLGAVATTFVAGVELIRRGLAEPIGSLTQMGTIRRPSSTSTTCGGSTAPMSSPGRASETLPRPSMLYAYAALREGVPFINGAPNLTIDVPAMVQLARTAGVPVGGKDFKTGQTLVKTVLAPMLKARMLGLQGWYSTNILGNRDGEVLDDPDSFRTEETSKLGVLEHILQPGRYPQLYGEAHHKVCINYYPAPRRQQGRLGQHRPLRLARLSDAAQGRLPVPRLDSGRAPGS